MADTHLGRTGFHKVDPDTGENLRAKFLYDNFLTNIRKFIDLKPDFIVHSGDLFDMVKPQNKAFVVAAEAINMLNEAGIPFYCIAGNHSMIKTKYTSSPFSLMDYIKREDTHIRFAYQFSPIIFFEGDCEINLIPNMHHREDYVGAVDWINSKMDPSYNQILVMHGLCSGIKNKRLNTMAEIEIGEEITESQKFDYIALGHYHNQERIAPHIHYSGSMEYLTYGEINDMKGALMIDTDKFSVTPIDDLALTPMMRGRSISCKDESPAKITEDILFQIENWPNMCMGQITLKDIGPEKASALDHAHINQVAGRLLHLKLKRDDNREERPVIDTSEEIRSINYQEEFVNYVKSLGHTEKETANISEKGVDIITKVLSKV